jgi:TatD DNase family protein
MIDSHAHLYFDRFDEDRATVIERAHAAGVREVINVGIDLATSQQAIALARQHPGMYATVGLHPTTPVDNLEHEVTALRSLAQEEASAVVAVGEIGLDYYWKEIAPELQRPKLRLQLDLARDLGLPVIFHCRDALADLFEVLESQPDLPPGVFHCFSGDANDARRALGLGFHISFAGNVTYPKATELQSAASVVPAEKLLLETDSPFLPPQKRRGKRNEPAFLPLTRDFLAELKGLEGDALATLATATTRRLFGLPKPPEA